MAQNESKLARSSLDDIAPNNSDKSKRGGPERKKVQPIVTGQVIKQKRTFFTKVKEAFLGESNSENLGDFILYDILVPAVRDTLGEMGYGIVGRLFGGGAPRARYGGSVVRDKGRSYVSYNTITSDNRRDRRDVDRGSRARHDFSNVIFTNKNEAEDVLFHLADDISEYGEVTVRTFYELSNIESDYTDEAYGWTNLRDAYVDRNRNGYFIAFPPTRPL